MRTLILLPLAALLACTDTKTEQGISGTSGEDGASGEEGVPGEDGEDGEDGDPGVDGEDGEDGSDGVPCWDLDGDGVPDPEEDTNGDGVVDVDDCWNDGSSGGDDTGGSSGATGGVYLGDLSISHPDQATHFCDHYDTVYGHLYVTAWPAEDIAELSCLREVLLNAYFSGNMTTSISLPNLENVGGTLTVQGLYTEEVRFDTLTTVGGLNIDQVGTFAPGVVEVEFPALIETQDQFYITTNGMQEVGFPALTTVGDYFTVNNNDRLLNVDGFPALETVGGYFHMNFNDSLCNDDALDLASRVSVGGVVSVSDNDGPCP